MAQINKPTDYFNIVTWSGNSSNPRNITGVGFQPDMVLGKIKSTGGNHYAIDVVRGSGTGTLNTLNIDDTSAEQTNTSGGSTSFGVYTSFDSDGFTVNAGSLSAKNTNESGQTYIAWNWKANGSGASNTDGSITSTVSANNTDGFSIVKYTGTGSAGTVGHGLSTAPKVLINKALGTQDWFVGHSSIGFTKFLKLNEANAESTNSGIWNNTAPTSSVFTINSANGNTNSTGVEYITYCFSEVKGFSKFGLYQGNGSADGAFIYTGFKPAFILYKGKGAVQSWNMNDNKRLGYNPNNAFLFPDLSQAESNITRIDLLSNGFKLRTTDAGQNGSGQGYIYMAFAENPLVGTNGVPACAR